MKCGVWRDPAALQMPWTDFETLDNQEIFSVLTTEIDRSLQLFLLMCLLLIFVQYSFFFIEISFTFIHFKFSLVECSFFLRLVYSQAFMLDIHII